MKTRFLLVASGLAISLYAPVGPPAAQAQTPTQPGSVATSVTREIPLKNVAPETMAWWLDPIHNPTPEIFKASVEVQPGENQGSRGDFSGPENLGGRFQLDNIQRVGPGKSPNELEVVGTEAAIADIRLIAAILDKPLHQIQITAQYAEINSEDLKTFLPAHPEPSSSFWKMAILPANFRVRLAQLITKKKATVEPAQVATAVAGFGRNVVVLDKDAQMVLSPSWGNKHPVVIKTHNSIRFTITPSRGEMGTAQVMISEPTYRSYIEPKSDEKMLETSQVSGPSIISNLHDGDTVMQYATQTSHLSSAHNIPLVTPKKIPSFQGVLLVTLRSLPRDASPVVPDLIPMPPTK